MNEPVLCYVKGAWAFFTTCPLDKQWGDDWDDAPYEHNAEEPYEWREGRDVPEYRIVRVAWCGGHMTPADIANGNSRYSVQQINRRFVPWLTPFGVGEPVFAGETLREFVRKVRAAGGEVFMSQADWELVK